MLSDRGRQVRGRVLLDENGAPREFTTRDRFFYDPEQRKQLIRTPWSLTVSGWQLIEGRRVPAAVRAVWNLPNRPFAYGHFRPIPAALAFNVRPGE